MKTDFETTCYAKCILAGEHSVLRGGSAVAVPVSSKYLTLKYHDVDDFKLVCHDKVRGQKIDINYQELMSFAFALCGFSREIAGNFEIEVDIPMGSGLGGSAALCVALGRFMVWKGLITKKDMFQFSTDLEGFFHGKSSGVDIAAILNEGPILYDINEGTETIDCDWLPPFYLSYSGVRSETRRCIESVSSLRETESVLAAKVDAMMQESVQLMIKGLQKSKDQGLDMLKQGIQLSEECFEKWGLIPEVVRTHIDLLKSKGALAVKPTGSGRGGYILSLFNEQPLMQSESDFFRLHVGKNAC